MPNLNIKDISRAMQNIDICMMATHDNGLGLESRPMSNNKDVEYKGDSWFFALEDASVIRHLKKNPKVCLSYEGKDMYISVAGEAYINQNMDDMKDHWVPDLEKWFENGINTPGLSLIHVKAERVNYWNGREDGEIVLT